MVFLGMLSNTTKINRLFLEHLFRALLGSSGNSLMKREALGVSASITYKVDNHG